MIKITVEHAARVAGFNAGTQVLHARLIKHVAADLVTPADVRLRLFELRLRFHAFAHFQLIELSLELLHGFFAVAVLRAVILTDRNDAGGLVVNSDG